jgi:hypothetical protein
MSLKSELIKRFLTSARSLANQGLSKEAIMQFAKNEFGEVTELFKKQIDNIFKPGQGIKSIKMKDPDFDDTVVKMQFDDLGTPFNPKDPLKDYSKKPRDEKYTGGLVDVEPSLSDIGHGSDALMARTRLMSPGSQATTSTGLNYLLAEDNDNIRVPFAGGGSIMTLMDGTIVQIPSGAYKDGKFKDIIYSSSKGDLLREEIVKGLSFAEGGRIGFSKGKLADAARRKFMKAAGTGAAGLAALKTGLIGLGEKAAPVAKEVIETVSETAQGVPPYFLNLVNKIRKMGESTLATKDKANAYKFKDYVMEEDFAGNIEIIKKGDDVAEDVYMSYKVDDVPVKKGGSSKVEEYEEYTARPDAEGKMKDIEQGVPDEVVQEGTMFEDDMTDFGKASGGIARMLGE